MATPPRTTTAGRVFNDLRNAAHKQRRGTDELLVMYVLERWLYRASTSSHRTRFILKGGLLLAALDARRPTRDADLLASIDNDEAVVVACVSDIASIGAEDGVTFQVDMTRTATIREDNQYAGLRVTMPASLGQARTKLALDINFGDPVTPGAVLIPYPSVLGTSTFDVLAYPIETVLAEKIVTAIGRGDTNTRERDWADVWRLSRSHDLDAEPLSDALRRTAHHRDVRLAPLIPRIGDLVRLRSAAYRTWRSRQGPDSNTYPAELIDVVADVSAFADPLIVGAASGKRWDRRSRRWLDPG